MIVITHKHGNTFKLVADFMDTDLTGVTITSQIRGASGNLVADLTCTPTSTSRVEITHQDTTTWPIDLLETDVKLVFQNGEIISTETIQVKVVAGITT